ncbi:hypothetical protein ABT093_29940 [Kitasatospora sp. NPDC002551]|uniref:hypothetical protein n=1 Tax=Kitasatospora sp. NPDC002551 TaxID=3154539 RepID=UPI003330213E
MSPVVFTQLHSDRIGWASHRGRPFFPNAADRLHRADREHVVSVVTADGPRRFVPLQVLAFGVMRRRQPPRLPRLPLRG